MRRLLLQPGVETPRLWGWGATGSAIPGYISKEVKTIFAATGETRELPAYLVNAVERFCEKRGLDPRKFVNEILKTFLPLLLKSKEAREVFFRGSTGEFVAWFGRHRHR